MRFLTRLAARLDEARQGRRREPVAAEGWVSRPWQQDARYLADLDLKPGQTTWLTARAVSLKAF
jgi:hypothetical protein